MPYHITWLVPNKILKMELIGTIADGEMSKAYAEHMEMVQRDGEAPVHVILDSTEMNNMQIKLNEINSFTDTSAAQLFGWTVIVTDNHFVRFIASIFTKMTGSQFKTVETYEEGLAILKKQAPELLPDAV